MKPEDLFNENRGQQPEQASANSPLISLQSDLKIFSESIREVAVEIMVEGLSKYPIFVAHQHDLKLGELILDKNELNMSWSIHASTMEEFIEVGLIKKSRKEHFVSNYKNPNEFMCVFVIVPEGANFVFVPYE